MRFYMIDRIREVAPGKYVEGIKNITMSDDVFNEHFPGYPIFPGSLILEGLAQLSGLFFEYCIKEQGLPQKRAALSMVNRMKYRRLVIPGDQLVYRADVKMFYPDEYAVVTVKAVCDGELCAEGELFFTFLDIMDEEMKQTGNRLMEMAFKQVKIVDAK